MFTCVCLDGDGDISLVLLKGDALSLGDERLELLEHSLHCHPSRKLGSSSMIHLVEVFDVKDI